MCPRKAVRDHWNAHTHFGKRASPTFGRPRTWRRKRTHLSLPLKAFLFDSFRGKERGAGFSRASSPSSVAQVRQVLKQAGWGTVDCQSTWPARARTRASFDRRSDAGVSATTQRAHRHSGAAVPVEPSGSRLRASEDHRWSGFRCAGMQVCRCRCVACIAPWVHFW